MTVGLLAVTPESWYDMAQKQLPQLLIDHANCEKKAASTALGLMFAYADDAALGVGLARLAREELRHYEQVVRLMADLGVAYTRLSPSRYAGELRRALINHEPARRLDLMIVGALIEARSCERFAGLVGRVPVAVSTFYENLHAAEMRHQHLYLNLAQQHAEAQGLDVVARFKVLAEVEAELVTRPDAAFRFHSGCPS
jgi:tRNA-(ms[2]io[6]A)-hydroxylase